MEAFKTFTEAFDKENKMKDYLFIMGTKSGCDYTIGCDYCYSECELENITCYEISNYTSFEKFKKRIKRIQQILGVKRKIREIKIRKENKNE